MINLLSDIDTRIFNAVECGKTRFAICPMGANGILTKRILNYRYGITEELLIDNHLASADEKVISPADLKHYDTNDLTILLNTTKKEINTELQNELLETIPQIQIINILAPSIMAAPKKECFFTKLHNVLKVMDVENPISPVGYIRVGRENDGGYIMLDDIKSTDIAYSFGICDDVSWDSDITCFGAEVYQYDHTIDTIPVINKRFHFHKTGISGSDVAGDRLLTMETILKQNGHFDLSNLILKMDVEGAEWDFLNTTSAFVLTKFSQIVLELHSLTDIQRESIVIPVLEKLNQTHQVIWVHGNNYGYAQKAGEVTIPASLEVTYARRSDYTFCKSTRSFPMEIDMPCCAERPDINLGDWS